MATVAQNLQTIIEAKEDIRQAIVDQGVACGTDVPLTSYATKIGQIEGGGGGGGGGGIRVSEGVNFYDYEGTLVASYNKTDALALTALPSNPSHTGLVAQGWNWTLQQIKDQLNNVGGVVNVGQMYTTDDGKTRLYITLGPASDKTVTIAWSQTSGEGVAIDWGDGSAAETASGVGSKTLSHTYSSVGDYVITMECSFGSYSFDSHLFGDITNNQKVLLKKIEIGNEFTSIGGNCFANCVSMLFISVPDGVSIKGSAIFSGCKRLSFITIPSGNISVGSNCFNGCSSLTTVAIPSNVNSFSASFNYCRFLSSITIPNGITSISKNCFSECLSLDRVVFPNSVTSIGESSFSYCHSLSSIVLPSRITQIKSSLFYNADALKTIVIPSSVTSIGTYAFSGCDACFDFYFYRTTPPTLANANAFIGLSSGATIHVPAASLEAYQTATNWSTYAAHMVGDL